MEVLEKNGKATQKIPPPEKFFEETIGVLGSQYTLRKMIVGNPKTVGSSSGHPTFILPSKYYGNVVAAFKKERYGGKYLSHSQREMVDIVPVEIKTLKAKILKKGQLLIRDNKGQLRPLRKASEGAIRSAIKKGLL